MKIGRIETFYVPPRWLFVREHARLRGDVDELCQRFGSSGTNAVEPGIGRLIRISASATRSPHAACQSRTRGQDPNFGISQPPILGCFRPIRRLIVCLTLGGGSAKEGWSPNSQYYRYS